MRLLSKADLKYTFRQLAKSPGFILLSVTVLAGSLAVSLFTFTVSYILAYKPLELTNGDSIVAICGEGGFGGSCLPFKAFEFASIREDITLMDNIGVYQDRRAYVDSEETIRQAAITATEWNMFQLSESTALLGRTLQASDQLPGAEPVAVLAHGFWQLAFDGDRDIVDQYVNVGGEPVRVVGVMPEGYSFPRWSDMWVPMDDSVLAPAVNGMNLVYSYGRLADGASRSEASEELASLMFRMRDLFPPDPADDYLGTAQQINEMDSGFVATVPGRDWGNLGNQLFLGALNLMSGIIFLLACINVGTLLLARTNERLKDLSIRVALGAPRIRLLLQTMGESVVIALLGASFAVLVAGLWLESMNIFLTTILGEQGVQFWIDFQIEGLTLFVALLFALLTVLVTTALPAWKLINGSFNSVMQDGTRGAVGLRTGRFSRSLVVVAITLITIFLYLGTVGIYSITQIGQTYELLDEAGKYSVEIRTGEQFANSAERLQFYRSLQTTLQQHPDVEDLMMLGVVGREMPFEVEGRSYLREEDKPTSSVQMVSGDLETIGSFLLQGRYLDNSDNQTSVRSALVSRSLADRLLPQQSPLGQSIRINDPGRPGQTELFQIVGMVSDTPVDGTEMFAQERDMIYVPLGQLDSSQITAIITSSAEPVVAALLLRNTVQDLNSAVDMNILDWVESRQTNTYIIRFVTSVAAMCGMFAFLVSIAGIFGLTKNSVILQTQEIGTRRALGATDRMIRSTFTHQGARQLMLGFLWAAVVTTPFTIIIYFAAGPSFLATGVLAALVIVSILLACTLLAIRQPIRQILKREPAVLLHHQ